jgi:hypothetical protein
MSQLFQELDGASNICISTHSLNSHPGTRNEIAHAQYTTQISHRKSDVLSKARTAISDLVPQEILMLEGALSLFTTTWLRLQTDSLDIFNWVQHNRVSSFSSELKPPDLVKEPPPCISAYLHGGYTVYSTLVNALDTYVEAIDSNLQQLTSS